MLETLDLERSVERAEYRKRLPDLQRRLHTLQRACYFNQIGHLVVFEGWLAAGKGRTIKKLTERLEPRALSVFWIHEPRTHERAIPWMWRFWRRLPNWGEMAIFNRSWYSQLVTERVAGHLSETEWLRRCRDVRFFEDTLAADRYLVTKFFLHIDQSEQRSRLEAMADAEETAWRVDEAAWLDHHRFADRLEVVEATLEQTEAEWGPWTLVAATDKYWTRLQVMETLVRRIEDGLERFGVSDRDAMSEEDRPEAPPGAGS